MKAKNMVSLGTHFWSFGKEIHTLDHCGLGWRLEILLPTLLQAYLRHRKLLQQAV